MVNLTANTTVVGPFLPNDGTGVYGDLVDAVDTQIATALSTNTIIVKYIKAGESSESLYAFITSYV